MIEEWRTVIYSGEVYEDYEVSSYGQIRSLKYGKIKILKLGKSGDGYLQVNLCKNTKIKHCNVHRVVAEVFIPNPDNLLEINHINEDKTDNRVENLEWTTRKQNNSHGTRTERVSKKCKKRVLCVETGEVFESLSEIQKRLGLAASSISNCCNGKAKTCGGYHWQYYND